MVDPLVVRGRKGFPRRLKVVFAFSTVSFETGTEVVAGTDHGYGIREALGD